MEKNKESGERIDNHPLKSNEEHKSLAEEEASTFSVGTAAFAYSAKLGTVATRSTPEHAAVTRSSGQEKIRNYSAAIW